MSSPRIGVLAVQGAFAEHAARLRNLGCSVVELRQQDDVRQHLDGLVLPGGESTAQTKLLRDLGMMEPLRQLIQEGLPTLGTCAGLILLAENVESTGDGRVPGGTVAAADLVDAGEPDGDTIGFACSALGDQRRPDPVVGFRTLPVTVRRNGYGRQLGSFTATAPLHVKHAGGVSRGANNTSEETAAEDPIIPLTFIRAPRIIATAPKVETLVQLNGEPVAVRYRNQIACCFHPELDADNAIYQLLLSL